MLLTRTKGKRFANQKRRKKISFLSNTKSNLGFFQIVLKWNLPCSDRISANFYIQERTLPTLPTDSFQRGWPALEGNGALFQYLIQERQVFGTWYQWDMWGGSGEILFCGTQSRSNGQLNFRNMNKKAKKWLVT